MIKIISITTGALVGLLAILAFVLSYSSLQHMAAAHGVGPRLSYLWPLLLDFAMIVFSLAILRANLRQERAGYPWSLTVAFAALATAGNVLDVSAMADILGIPAVIIAASVKALAPVALVLAFELLMSMVKAEIRRADIVRSVSDLAAECDTLARDRDAHAAAVSDLVGQIEALAAERDAVQADISAAKSRNGTDLAAARQAKIDTRRAGVLDMIRAGMDISEIKEAAADKWSVTPRTIGRDIDALNGHLNGHNH